MKILIVNTYDKEGGASIAAYRLHKALLKKKVSSIMLVQKKLTDDYTVLGATSKKQKFFSVIKYYIDQWPVFFYKNRTNNLFSPSWFSFGDILKQIHMIKPDVVHLHWVCKGMLSVRDLAKINIPIVWTLHDSWAFTGGCHIEFGCRKYVTGCGSCPELNSNKQHDLSNRMFNKKINSYSKINNMSVVTVSRWLKGNAKDSALMAGMEICNIPNPIDTSIYKPLNKIYSKSVLNLDKQKKIILFGAMSAVDDKNKGYAELLDALNKLKLDSGSVELIVFGSSKPNNEIQLKYNVTYLGYINDDISLQVIYSAADVMVVPSRQESFGQTASESMSCGTPVVAFGTSGLLDIVEHKINGYLAEPYNTADLAKGIQWVLLESSYNELSKNARDKVLRQFDSNVVSDSYISLYQSKLAD